MISELVILDCRCGNRRDSLVPGGEVNLAEFLRCAIGAGWRRIDEEQINVIRAGDGSEVEIYLAGQCDRCTASERAAFKAAPSKAP